MPAPSSPTDATRKGPRPRNLVRYLAGWPAVVVLLATFWGLATSSVLDKCNTFDEMAHLTSGYTYLTLGDYRLNPSNICLSQILGALPLGWSEVQFPSLDQPAWRERPHFLPLGHQFFYLSGNDIQSLLWRARAMIALAGCVLGLGIYAWARRLFGPAGGLISLATFAFCPPLLANSSLVTTDLMVSLTFLLASGCFWNMLQKVTGWTVLLSGLSIAALMLSKLTGVFFAPMALGLIVVRLAAHRPLPVRFFRTWQISSRPRQVGVLLISILVQGMIVVATIWAMFGFRYSAYNPKLGDYASRDALWERALAQPGIFSDGFAFARDHRLLPEAYLYTLAATRSDVQTRKAFLNGQYSYYGWRRFFPYAFLVKTPLTLLGIVVLSAAAAVVKWRRGAREKGKKEGKKEKTSWTVPAREALYTTAPLWMLLGVYWLGAITSKLNIGHRHILPTYPPLLVLAGGAAYWLRARSKAVGAVVIAALLALAAETVYRWPKYIAYFNQLIGGPANGYKHLVDSSLDWGQDLPSLKQWLQKQGLGDPTKTPVYLCYFGTASPTYFGIDAERLPGYVDLDSPPMPPHLEGGYYCVSATMLQSVVPEPFGGWTRSQEATYRSAMEMVSPLLQMNTDQLREIFHGPTGPQYQRQMLLFDQLRQKRMMAYLRQREPIHQVNHSIFIYRLSDQEVAQATTGPPPELRPEIQRNN